MTSMASYADLDPAFLPIHDLCRPATMTSVERMYALYKAVEYVLAAGIPGDFVECGVWRGGSVMVMAATLVSMGCLDRRIWLYDTFAGMTPPTEHDVDVAGRDAGVLLTADPKSEDSFYWGIAPMDLVRANLAKVPYPAQLYNFVPGPVEQTIPRSIPERIALLRLDTDWYESTRHELLYLYPLLEKQGVLCIDDYGYWKGSRKAVDEYFAAANRTILLNRIDTTGRIAIKS